MALAEAGDVESALLRPLTSVEEPYVDDLLLKASALLRTAVPSIDTRVAAFEADPTDRSGVDPLAVATVVAGAVKAYIVNPRGLTSTSDTLDDVQHSEYYALRGDIAQRGVLQITPADLESLFPPVKKLRAGTIRTRPALAPRPVGRYGPIPTAAQAVSALIDFGVDFTPDAELTPVLPC